MLVFVMCYIWLRCLIFLLIKIKKLLSLSFRLKTRPACYDQQGAIACIPEDDI